LPLNILITQIQSQFFFKSLAPVLGGTYHSRITLAQEEISLDKFLHKLKVLNTEVMPVMQELDILLMNTLHYKTGQLDLSRFLAATVHLGPFARYLTRLIPLLTTLSGHLHIA